MSGRRANNEGSIYKRKDGRWAASISLDHGRRKYLYGKTRQEVGRKLTATLKARQDGLPILGERQTVGQYLRAWLESARPSLRPRTWRRYEQLVRLHALPDIGKMALARLTPDHLQRLYANRLGAGQSPASVVQLHAVLRRALNQAMRWGLVVRNVARLATPPRIRRAEMTTFSSEQSRAFLEAAQSDRLHALYVLALSTGMRQGELLALRWQDVDLHAGILRVTATLQRTPEGFVFAEPKTARSRRQIALAGTAVGALHRHRVSQAEERLKVGPAWENNDLVFTNEVGQPLDGTRVSHSFRRLLEKTGLPRIRFHDLRHTAATLMLGRGVHPKVASEMLGHAQISITLDLYSHVSPTMQAEAAAALDAILRG